MRSTLLLAALACTLSCAIGAQAEEGKKASAEGTETAVEAHNAEAATALDFKVKDIDGKDVDLAQYKGKVVMIVNVASKCGLTPQYEQLEALYDKYKAQGFVILGFPANNFNGQEPGTNEEIKFFCQEKYEVEFPLFEKISVKGEDQAPLYQYLTSEVTNGEFAGDIQWNFQKFLVGKDGKVIAKFAPRTKPDEAEVVEKIEAALQS